MATTWIRVPLQLSEEDHQRLVLAAELEGLRPVSLARMYVLRGLREHFGRDSGHDSGERVR